MILMKIWLLNLVIDLFFIHMYVTNEGHSVVRGYSTTCESRAILLYFSLSCIYFNSAVCENRTIYLINSLTMCFVTDEFKRTKLFLF